MSMKTVHAKPKLIVIVGPTGIGKTATAMNVAEAFGGEIIGADSMQIYRTMDIGTAKPTAEEQARVRHHMIDVADPDEPFDAARYARMAREQAEKLIENGKMPIVAGGTGFYVRALLNGLAAEAITDRAIRSQLKQEAVEKGGQTLHNRLSQLDPEAARRIHPNDTFRIIRALEVQTITGRPISSLQLDHHFGDDPYDALMIGLTMDREPLYTRINRRVETMLEGGLVDEVNQLLKRGYAPDLKSMQSIGYRHMVLFIEGKLSMTEAVRTMQRDTRRYAKRQMTWFKKNRDTLWLAPGDQHSISSQVASFLDHQADD